jgi:hypothetical protein
VDVTGIEPVTHCLQSEWGINSKSLFRLRLTRRIHQSDTPLVAPKMLRYFEPSRMSRPRSNSVSNWQSRLSFRVFQALDKCRPVEALENAAEDWLLGLDLN